MLFSGSKLMRIENNSQRKKSSSSLNGQNNREKTRFYILKSINPKFMVCYNLLQEDEENIGKIQEFENKYLQEKIKNDILRKDLTKFE